MLLLPGIIWGFPKIRGTLLGVPIIRIIVFWGLHWGPIIGVPLFWETTILRNTSVVYNQIYKGELMIIGYCLCARGFALM